MHGQPVDPKDGSKPLYKNKKACFECSEAHVKVVTSLISAQPHLNCSHQCNMENPFSSARCERCHGLGIDCTPHVARWKVNLQRITRGKTMEKTRAKRKTKKSVSEL